MRNKPRACLVLCLALALPGCGGVQLQTPILTPTPEPSATLAIAGTPVPPIESTEPSPPAERVPFTFPEVSGGPVYAAQVGALWVYTEFWDSVKPAGIYAIELDAPDDVQPVLLWSGGADFLVCGERILFLDKPDEGTPIRGILIDPATRDVEIIDKRQREFYIPYHAEGNLVYFPHEATGMLAVLDLATMITRDVLDPTKAFTANARAHPVGRIGGETVFVAYANDAPDEIIPWIDMCKLWAVSDEGDGRPLNDLIADFSVRIIGEALIQPTVDEQGRILVLHHGQGGVLRILEEGPFVAPYEVMSLFPGYALGAAEAWAFLRGDQPGEKLLIGEDRVFRIDASFSRRPRSYQGRAVPFDSLYEDDGIPIEEFPVYIP